MKCLIQWIDVNGEPTPDTNEATCLAVIIHTDSGGRSTVRKFPCCAVHEVQLNDFVAAGLMTYGVHSGTLAGGTYQWKREPLPIES